MRLTKAAVSLRDEGEKVIDVAFDFVFDSHEGFTRAFSKAFGIPPQEYRKRTPPILLFLPARAYDSYHANHKGEAKMTETPDVKAIFVQVVERPARKLLLKRGIAARDYFAYCDEVGRDVWGVLTSVKEALYDPSGCGCRSISSKEPPYVQGVELPLDYADDVPAGFDRSSCRRAR